MKTAIIYATKYGATKKVAEKLATMIPKATVFPLAFVHADVLEDYQNIIIGSPITAGMVDKELKAFVGNYQEKLKQHNVGLFLCGLQPEQASAVFVENFSAELLTHATVKAFVGGIYDPTQCSFFSKLVMKKVAGLTTYTNQLDEDKINEIAAQFS